ncbi:MAG: hypothetical protein ACH346_05470 [Chthoniobacterales bacterium]
MRKNNSGSALLAVFFLIILLSGILFLLLQTAIVEKKSTNLLSAHYQARLAAQSGLSMAMNQLANVTRNHPGFLVGASSPIGPLVIGAMNLCDPSQITSLVSGESTRVTNNPKNSVDLNKKNFIASKGCYYASYVTITNSLGRGVARYATIFLDEQARLNPALHQGKPRTDPINWDQGASSIPLFLGDDALLLSLDEVLRAQELCSKFLTVPSLGSLELIFPSLAAYDQKKLFLTIDQTMIPDLIPNSLPEGGNPKYDLNDLATNPIYGGTPSDRATNIAAIIDYNLPLFKTRDPSLKNATDQRRYLNRLAACIVDYIDPYSPPILMNGGEPAGRGFFPLVTQTAERCKILQRMSNSVTIENQYFIQLWNPYTTSIPAGATAAFCVSNRQRLQFGAAPTDPFYDYAETNFSTPLIRPNESVVLSFPSVSQTWTSLTNVHAGIFPSWKKAPEGNFIPTQHQAFTFFWNGQLSDMSRRLPIAPGICDGGLDHNEETLTNNENFWQCDFIPTQQDKSGHFRFVGDPRENYLSNYLWKTLSGQKSYLETCWQGAMTNGSTERLFSIATSWSHRDFVPVNPVAGNKPTSLAMTPDKISTSYQEARDGIMAPLVLRRGPMNSIAELGNINDPAQADDLGMAPLAGSSDGRSSIYASGGGRTLRIGQPEFSYWDVPGKRAIELIDLFSVATTNNTSASMVQNYVNGTNRSTIWHTGLININTAPHEVLTALFYGITPTSDPRFTNSTISLRMAEQLATFVQEHRPYEKLSDLEIITPLLANADTYEPLLAVNVTEDSLPLAAVVDRAREEAFGKMISLCTVQSRAFRVYILGQSLDLLGKPTGEAMLEATIALLADDRSIKSDKTSLSRFRLIPTLHNIRWLE